MIVLEILGRKILIAARLTQLPIEPLELREACEYLVNFVRCGVKKR